MVRPLHHAGGGQGARGDPGGDPPRHADGRAAAIPRRLRVRWRAGVLQRGGGLLLRPLRLHHHLRPLERRGASRSAARLWSGATDADLSAVLGHPDPLGGDLCGSARAGRAAPARPALRRDLAGAVADAAAAGARRCVVADFRDAVLRAVCARRRRRAADGVAGGRMGGGDHGLRPARRRSVSGGLPAERAQPAVPDGGDGRDDAADTDGPPPGQGVERRRLHVRLHRRRGRAAAGAERPARRLDRAGRGRDPVLARHGGAGAGWAAARAGLAGRAGRGVLRHLPDPRGRPIVRHPPLAQGRHPPAGGAGDRADRAGRRRGPPVPPSRRAAAPAPPAPPPRRRPRPPRLRRRRAEAWRSPLPPG